MGEIAITVKLPEEVAARAQAAGLLSDQRITMLLLTELERLERTERLFNNMDKLAALEPPLTSEEIADEIRAFRDESA